MVATLEKPGMKGEDGMKGPAATDAFSGVFEALVLLLEEVVSWQVVAKPPRGCCQWGISMPISHTWGVRMLGEAARGNLLRKRSCHFPEEGGPWHRVPRKWGPAARGWKGSLGHLDQAFPSLGLPFQMCERRQKPCRISWGHCFTILMPGHIPDGMNVHLGRKPQDQEFVLFVLLF